MYHWCGSAQDWQVGKEVGVDKITLDNQYMSLHNLGTSKNLFEKFLGHPPQEVFMIISSIPKLRDPFIVVNNGIYYAYGTEWHCYRNISGSLSGAWEDLGQVVPNPTDDGGQHWAPEVHRYKNAFYMITTYRSSQNQHRGCMVLKSNTPEGPFACISQGHVTPKDWDCIDGTLYIDKEGQPWMVFVHEWTCQPDHVGTFAAARLSDDLSALVSEPIELFRADAPTWAKAGVTDGCFMYTTQKGDLLMLWSNFASDGYCVGIARSDNGTLDGNWTQDEQLLFSKTLSGEYDGGHGMLFYDTDGQMYLSIHSPQTLEGADRLESPVFVPVREQNNTLVWDR